MKTQMFYMKLESCQANQYVLSVVLKYICANFEQTSFIYSIEAYPKISSHLGKYFYHLELYMYDSKFLHPSRGAWVAVH